MPAYHLINSVSHYNTNQKHKSVWKQAKISHIPRDDIFGMSSPYSPKKVLLFQIDLASNINIGHGEFFVYDGFSMLLDKQEQIVVVAVCSQDQSNNH